MTTPPKPARFDPEIPPPGFELKLVPFWRERSMIVPRLQLVHTNGAPNESDVEGAYNWAMRNTWPGYLYGDPPGGQYTTIPHLQIDRSGRGALLLPSNRKSITNARANPFSLGFETADTGTKDDPAISAFTDKQAEAIAVACAYYAWGHKIPLEYPQTWDGSGTASHTEPFGYPLWTNANGKICPGTKKKRQVRDIVLPRARDILAAWTSTPAPQPPPPPPPAPLPEPDPPSTNGATMGAPILLRYGGTPTANWSGYFSFDGITRQAVRGMHHAALLVALGGIDAKDGHPIDNANWSDVTHTNNSEELDEWLTPGRD